MDSRFKKTYYVWFGVYPDNASVYTWIATDTSGWVVRKSRLRPGTSSCYRSR